MRNATLSISVLMIFGASLASAASGADDPNVGTLTAVEGEVKLLTHPSSKPHPTAAPSSARALFEGEYFLVRDARAGDPLEQGNVIRTAPGAKARLVYPNGDQFNVGGGTAYRIHWKPRAGTQIHLMYGKVRGIIEKGGPRKGLLIKSKTATMGVRGTDFFVAADSAGSMEVSVLRGQVEVKAEGSPARPVQVEASQTATVSVESVQKAATSAEAPASAPEVRRTTQEELQSIHKTTQFAAQARKDLEAAPPAIARLEAQAATATLKDIEQTDPKLFARLAAQGDAGSPQTSAAEINAAAVRQILQTAPAAPKSRKPFKSELGDLEGDAYKQYFKTVE